MSARRGRVSVLPAAYPPLDRTACIRCGTVGVHVVAMWEDAEHVPHEALYCNVACAEREGWPWLRSAAAEALWRTAGR